MRGDLAGLGRFVERVFPEADREGANRLARLRLHQRDDGGGIDSAGQKCPERHIGQALTLDRDRQQPLQFGDRLPLVRDAICLCGDDRLAQRPIRLWRGHTAGASISAKVT